MIQAMYNQRLEVMESPPSHPAVESANFAELFGDATKTGAQVAALPAASAVSDLVSTVPPAQTSLGDPDVQGWLNSYYTEEGAPSASANTSYQPGREIAACSLGGLIRRVSGGAGCPFLRVVTVEPTLYIRIAQAGLRGWNRAHGVGDGGRGG